MLFSGTYADPIIDVQIVDETSASPTVQDVERAVIQADHSHMCKFENENAPGFDLVVEGIQRYAEDAPAKIKRNWDAENQERTAAKQAEAAELYSGMLCPSPLESWFNDVQPASRTHLRRDIRPDQTPAVPLEILH